MTSLKWLQVRLWEIWSEVIAENEALAGALDRLNQPVKDTLYENLRTHDDVVEAVAIASSAHPKGPMLAQAWRRGLELPNSGLRAAELRRVAMALRTGIGVRIRRA